MDGQSYSLSNKDTLEPPNNGHTWDPSFIERSEVILYECVFSFVERFVLWFHCGS